MDKMDKEMNLKPCPFCGGRAELVESDSWSGVYAVHCTQCGAQIGDTSTLEYGTTRDEAIALWNRRDICEALFRAAEQSVELLRELPEVIKEVLSTLPHVGGEMKALVKLMDGLPEEVVVGPDERLAAEKDAWVAEWEGREAYIVPLRTATNDEG